MKRIIILLLDSFGIGPQPDAEKYGDAGTNTLANIAQMRASGKIAGGALQLPNMTALGLNQAEKIATGKFAAGLATDVPIKGAYGCAAELSKGKDTTSGHWEIMGAPVLFEWGYFPPTYPSFPQELVDEFCKQAKVPGILGNKHASGTEIITEFGDEHVRTGKPIVYTSADSVFQIAAHEESFGLERLYQVCKIARKLVDKYNIGRVIARPFLGSNGKYTRTANRHDYSVVPPEKTVLNEIVEAGGEVISVGKIADIFANSGISKAVPPLSGNMGLFDSMLNEMKTAGDKSLIFVNYIDFDMSYGHRRDIAGYAKALEEFDARLPELQKMLQPGDIAIITADHGCDPTYQGSDHTRELIPILVFGKEIKPVSIGMRTSFADIGQTCAEYFGLPLFKYGKSFLKEII